MELESRLESDVTSARHRTPGLDEPWPCWAWPWANRRGAEWTCADAAAGKKAGGCAFPMSPRYYVPISSPEGHTVTDQHCVQTLSAESGRESRVQRAETREPESTEHCEIGFTDREIQCLLFFVQR